MKKPAILLLATIAASLVLTGGALAATVDCRANSFCEGTPRDDVLKGAAGGEEIHGLGGKDVLRGFEGFDFLKGGAGNDRLRGGSDGDTYLFGNFWGADTVADVSGFDSLDFSFLTAPLKVDLAPRASRAEARSEKKTVNFGAEVVIEQVQGGISDDLISGNGVRNALEGDEGDDTIDGRGGPDGLGGGNGNDTLIGGPGRDIIYGRNGNDTIRAADGEADEIFCGDGSDTVYFDPGLDEVGGKCDIQNPAQQP